MFVNLLPGLRTVDVEFQVNRSGIGEHSAEQVEVVLMVEVVDVDSRDIAGKSETIQRLDRSFNVAQSGPRCVGISIARRPGQIDFAKRICQGLPN